MPPINPVEPEAAGGGIIWLASFPKSGNTWLRAFLHNYFQGGTKPADINDLDSFTQGDAQVRLFEAVRGGSLDGLDDSALLRLRQSVHRHLASRSRDTTFVKTHNALISQNGIPLVTMAVTAGAIYLVRNPLDIVPSFADHFGLSLDQAIESLADPDLMFPTTAENVLEVSGSWSRHVASWTARPHPRIHVIRYEDLHARPAASFGALISFLGLPDNAARLDQAMDAAAFDGLRAQERDHGFKERSRHARRFFRSGRVNGWRRVLTSEQAARVIATHRRQMQRFGYPTELA